MSLVTVPKVMTAVLSGSNGNSPAAGEAPVPTPGSGEVLVRIAAAPINPSDIGFLNGGYSSGAAAARIPGFEGSGTVVAAGTGIVPRLLLGKRVAVLAPSGGTWAEYTAVPALRCIPLPGSISAEQGSMLLVNPLTALAFCDMARNGRHAALVNTAAASALGRMILRLGRRLQVPVLHIVRREQQADALTTLGAEYVLESTDRNFEDKLASTMRRLQATLVLDAVGGRLSSQLLLAAPAGSTLVLYANLSGEQLTVDPRVLWTENKRIEGFFLGNWLAGRSLPGLLRDIRRVRSWGASDFQSHVRERFPLSGVQQAIEVYRGNMTAGKVVLTMDPA